MRSWRPKSEFSPFEKFQLKVLLLWKASIHTIFLQFPVCSAADSLPADPGFPLSRVQAVSPSPGSSSTSGHVPSPWPLYFWWDQSAAVLTSRSWDFGGRVSKAPHAIYLLSKAQGICQTNIPDLCSCNDTTAFILLFKENMVRLQLHFG